GYDAHRVNSCGRGLGTHTALLQLFTPQLSIPTRPSRPDLRKSPLPQTPQKLLSPGIFAACADCLVLTKAGEGVSANQRWLAETLPAPSPSWVGRTLATRLPAPLWLRLCRDTVGREPY